MTENLELSANELIRLYLSAPLEANHAQFLDLLIEGHAMPVIERSLQKKFRESVNNGFHLSIFDLDDLCSKSCLKLVERLIAMRTESNGNMIHDFDGYVAVVAFNTWNEFLIDGAPNRKSLKNKIRYALGKSNDVEVWKEREEIYCGLFIFKRRSSEILVEDLVNGVTKQFIDFRNVALPDLIGKILKFANSKILVNELVSIVAKLWAIDDYRDISLEEVQEYIFSEKRQRNELEMRSELEQLWQEIRKLPVNQRIALLYNLRDEKGREMLLMFFNMRIASLREISEAMNLSFEECAAVFPFLPMDDKTIGEKMKFTAKQVSNLRKVARENLRRRLDGKQKREKRGGDRGKE